DRAFTLEFSEIDLTNWESNSNDELISSHWPIHAWQPRATRLANLSITDSERDQINKTVDTLVRLNEILTQAQLQLAYRSRDEIALFVLHANDLLSSFVTRDGNSVSPLDLAVQMKVLPRIAGGSGAIRKLVLELLGWSWRGSIFKEEDDAKPLIAEWSESRKPQFLSTAEFPRTCARLCLMWERIRHEGYTSYWL
ncbi:MAG: hypothetical protein K2X81_10800, partial [Candidatus Obscuribacterales bacterium]|nr:hypothetical protein [Candidatus Obscuribacterales bacterium]